MSDPAALISNVSPARPSIVLDNGTVVAVFAGPELAEFMISVADADGLLALNEHSVGDLIDRIAGCREFILLDPSASLALLSMAISKKRYAVIVDGQGAPIGVIAAAHRRY